MFWTPPCSSTKDVTKTTYLHTTYEHIHRQHSVHGDLLHEDTLLCVGVVVDWLVQSLFNFHSLQDPLIIAGASGALALTFQDLSFLSGECLSDIDSFITNLIHNGKHTLTQGTLIRLLG